MKTASPQPVFLSDTDESYTTEAASFIQFYFRFIRIRIRELGNN